MTSLDRKINVIGDIDHAAYARFTRKISRLEYESEGPIHIVLCSDGGDASVALAFHDRIKMSPCEVTATAVGLVASAAVLILVAAYSRTMTRNSWCMVHDDQVLGIDDKRVCEAAKQLQHMCRIEDQWNRLMEEATGTSAEIWDMLHKAETYLSAKECLELGIIQEII